MAISRPIVPLFRTHWDESDISAVNSSIRRGSHWAEGPNIEKFEKALCEYTGAKHCVVFNSGTSALHASLLALGIGPGDEVIVPSFTFIATANCVLMVGAKPVFADIEPVYLGLDPEDVERKLSRRTKAIIPVHYGGEPCRIWELQRLAEMAQVKLIEDACLAGDTIITAKGGDRPIRDIKQGDYVMTRDGWRKVLAVKQTGIKGVIIRCGITATPDHPFITKKGVKTCDALSASDIMYVWNAKQLITEERSIADILSQRSDISVSISGENIEHFTLLFGKTIGVLSLKAWKYIIKTVTPSIINSLIFSWSDMGNINGSIGESNAIPYYQSSWLIWKWHARPLSNGTRPKQGKSLVNELPLHCGNKNRLIRLYAKCAASLIKHFSPLGLCSAPANVRTKVAVYNLTVEGSHEFFANGILVHNCESLGSGVGTYGECGVFSFCQNKVISTGEGGAVITDSKETANKLSLLRSHGRDSRQQYVSFGYNFRMPDLNAALGLSQLKKIDYLISQRRILAAKYRSHLDIFGSQGVYQMLTIRTKNRDRLQAYLKEQGIASKVYFHPVHQTPYYKALGYFDELPVTEQISSEVLSLPMYSDLSGKEVDYICEKVKAWQAQN